MKKFFKSSKEEKMKCPFCEKEMKKGIISGDGRSKIFWEPQNEKLSVMDKMVGKGMIDADYSLAKFKIQADYCENCQKMIFSTNISN